MRFVLADRLPVGAMRRTNDGYMVADVRAARTGIQLYAGRELGKPELPAIRVYRPEEEVFASESISSYAHKPVTNDHPPVLVDSTNWKQFAVGNVGGEILRDGDFVRVPLALMDQRAISDVEDGKREISMGYEVDIEFESGVSPKGEAYDAVMRKIRINHLALVDTARAGPECRIGDRKIGVLPDAANEEEVHHMTALKKVLVDGIHVEMTEQGAEAFAKVAARDAERKTALDAALAKIETLTSQSALLVADHKKVLDAKDGEIAALKATHKGEVEAINKKLADAETNLDARIEERQGVLTAAEKIAGKALDGKGKSLVAIKREAVVAKLGDKAVEGKSDDFVAASFDTLAALAGESGGDKLADAARGVLADRSSNTADGRKVAKDAYLEMVAGLGKPKE